MSPDNEKLLQRLVPDLAAIPGVVAVALGGSHARGRARRGSDLDLGLYYSEARPLEVAALRDLAARLHDGANPVVTEPWAWGPWVNGGSWLTIDGQRVDLLYRSVEHVERAIEDARAGRVQHHYGQQPPYGFWSVIYLGETACCQPLYDPAGILACLKEHVASYPPALKRSIVQDYLWLVEFTLQHARTVAERGQVYDTVGCLARCAPYLTQVLFALNEVYFVNDKTAMEEIAGFGISPRDFAARLEGLLAAPGADAGALSATVTRLDELFHETVALCGGLYRAKYPPPGT